MLRAPRAPLSSFDDMDTGVLGESLAGVLEKMISVNAEEASDDHPATIFDAVLPPTIRIRDYLRRIIKYVQCSSQCVVLALIYIDRLIERRSFLVTARNAHRVLLSAILVAAKSFDDEFYSNGFFSQVGGVQVAELNNLELEFVFLLQFSTFVPPDVYHQYAQSLMQATLAITPIAQGTRRIRECQVEPQNEPPSPKRWIEPQAKPPSPKRMNVSALKASLAEVQTDKSCCKDFFRDEKEIMATTFDFSISSKNSAPVAIPRPQIRCPPRRSSLRNDFSFGAPILCTGRQGINGSIS